MKWQNLSQKHLERIMILKRFLERSSRIGFYKVTLRYKIFSIQTSGPGLILDVIHPPQRLLLPLLLDDGATKDNAVSNPLPEHRPSRLRLEGDLPTDPFTFSHELYLAGDRLDGDGLGLHSGLHLVVGSGGDGQLGLLLLLLLVDALLLPVGLHHHPGWLGWGLQHSMGPTVAHGWQGLEMAVACVVPTSVILVEAHVERVASGEVLSLEAGVVVSLRDDARLDGVLVDPLHGWQADHWIVVPVVVPRTAGGVDHLPFLLRAGHDDLEALLLPPAVQGLLGHGQLCQTWRPAETRHLGLVMAVLSTRLTSGITESFLCGERGPPESPGAGLGTCSSSPEAPAGSQAEGSVLGGGDDTLLHCYTSTVLHC